MVKLACPLCVVVLLACSHGPPEAAVTPAEPAPDTLAALTCLPNPVERAQWIVCRMNEPRHTVTRWHFRADPDSVNPPLPDVENVSASWEWAGPMIAGGLVTVHVVDSAKRVYAFQEHVTVTPRDWSHAADTSGETPPPPPPPPAPPAAARDTLPHNDDSVLARHGELKVQAWSIHGASPLIVILTEAPASVTDHERWYRGQVTDLLNQYIASRGLSYYVLRDDPRTGPSLSPPEETLARLDRSARDVAVALRRKSLGVAAYVGLAEGAVVAARLAVHDSLPGRRGLAVLAPSLPGAAGKGTPHWDDVIQALHNGLPALLAMQSTCDGPMPDALTQAADSRQRLLLLPDHDFWLGNMRDTSCPPDRGAKGRLPSLGVAQMVGEWLGSWVVFPE